MILLSFSTIFDVNQRKFKVLDTTNYSGAGVLLSDVKGVIKITTPRGVTHVNVNYSSPDVNQSVGLESVYFSLPTNAKGYILAGIYSVEYSVKRMSTSEISVVTNSYTYSFIVPIPIITQIVDGYNSIFTSTDNTIYGSYFSLIRTHEVTPPLGSPLSVITNSNQNIIYPADIWSGIWTSQLTSVLVYHESDGLIINVSLNLTKMITAYLNDMNVIRGYIESFKLLFEQARATDKNLAYKYELSLEKINTSYVEYDLALYYNDLFTAYLRTVDIVKELSDHITITFPEDIVPFINHQGGSGHNPVSIGGVAYGVSINTNQVLSFSLATTLSGGMLKQLSGNATDYFGGDGNWHSLSSGTYALKSDFTAYDSVRAITATAITNWNTAFSWGNHASYGYAIASDYYTKVNLQTSGQSSVHWGNITNHPTTVSGYGISDAMSGNAPITSGTHTKITYDTKGLVTGGADLSASDIPELPWSKITSGLPTTLSGYGIIDAYTQAQIDVKTWPWSSITGTPTTLSDYGIADSYTQAQILALDWDFTTSIINKPTTLSGYGIIDAINISHPANNVINSGLGNLFLADKGTYIVPILNGVSDTQIVFTDGTATAGNSNLTWNKITNTLTVLKANIGTGLITTQLDFIDSTINIVGNTGNLVFTDSYYSKTLSQLVSGATNFWTASGSNIYFGIGVNMVGINQPSPTEVLDIIGNIQATDFNSSFLRYKNSNLLLGPNAGNLETGSNLLYIDNTNTSTPLIGGDFLYRSVTFNSEVYIQNNRRLSFGTSDVYIKRNVITGDLTFGDPNTNSGNPITLNQLFANSNYALKSDFVTGGYAAVTAISAADIAIWNKASILSTYGSTSLFLNQNGVYTSAGGGVTPTDNFAKWDTGSSYYRFYNDKIEAGGGASGGKLYLGTTDPTNTNRLNYDGSFHAFQISVFAIGSTNAIRGDSSNGIGVQATSNSGTALNAQSVTGVSVIINNGSTNTSDIAKFQKNSIDRVVINTSGINLITGSTYKINGIPLSYSNVGAEALLGNPSVDGYILSSTISGIRSWIAYSSSTSIADILNWDTNKYTPYTTQGAGHFDNGTVNPIHTNRLNYDGNFYSNKFLASDSVEVSITGNTGILDSAGYLVLDSNGYTITDSTSYNATSTLSATSLDITINGNSKTLFNPGVANGVSSVAYISDTQNTLSTTGALHTSKRNNGTEIFSIDKDGNVNIPSGASYKINGIPVANIIPVDGLLNWNGNAYNPYSISTIGKFDNSNTDPTDYTRLNYNGSLYVTTITSSLDVSGVTGIFTNDNGGNALVLGRTSSSNTIQSMFVLHRYTSGTTNDSGDIISILDNPTTSGTLTGSILKATVGSDIRIDFNPRVVSTGSAVAYMLDTHNSITTGDKILSLKAHGTEITNFDISGINTNLIRGGQTTLTLDGTTNGYTLKLISTATARTIFYPNVVDGASAVAYTFDTHNNLTTAGAKISTWKNQGVEQAYITNAGTIAGFNTLVSGLGTTNTTILNASINTTISGVNQMLLNPNVSDGGSAIAYKYNTANTLSTTGAKLSSWLNNGTEKVSIDKDGVIEIKSVGQGVVLASPDGTRYKLTIANGGTLTITSL